MSDLYAMRWKAVFDEDDFPERADSGRLSFVEESGNAYLNARQTSDVAVEQQKVIAADAVIFQFPLWWYSMPAVMKGWFDRVWAYGLAYGYKNAGNKYRYGEGAFKGKRAMLSVVVGGPEADYAPRGINGPLDELLFPITHGSLFFLDLTCFPPTPCMAVPHASPSKTCWLAKAAWRLRVERLFEDAPIPFRAQNGGDYPERHILSSQVAVGQTGLLAHIADIESVRQAAHHPFRGWPFS